MKEVYLDGTKIEANASRYWFVWGKSIKTRKKRIENQLEEIWKYACGIARDEMKDTEPFHYEQIAPEAVKQAIEEEILGKRNNYTARQTLKPALCA